MKRFAILLFTVISIAVMANPATVKLEYNFENNPFQAFQMSTKTQTEFTMFGMDQKTGSELILNINREAQKTNRTGIYKVKNTVDSGKIIIQGKESKYGGEGSFTEVMMDRTGKILENITEGKEITELQVNFPDKAVKIGDVWGTKARFDISDIAQDQKNLEVAITFIFKGYETYRGAKCAVIESRFETNRVNDKYLKLEIKGNGKIYFAYEEGKLLSNFSKLKIDLDLKSDDNKDRRLTTIFALSVDMLTQLTSM
ncbi:MAG: hypothetical protein WC002_06180 [Candidatus Muiribacteriota bacterium]